MKIRKFVFCSLMIFHSQICGADFQDLEDMSQDFVLDIQKIEIPGFPYAFNPSIIRYHGAILMSFRLGSYINGIDVCDDGELCNMPNNRVTTEIGVALFDEKFRIMSAPQILHIPRDNEDMLYRPQDPRLVHINGALYIAYNNYVEVDSIVIQRMHFAELYFDGENFVLGEPEGIKKFDKLNPQRTEKNWSPFDYEGELYFEYSFQTHKVLKPILGTGSCETVGLTTNSIRWDWGHIRGGSPAIRFGDEYLGFFHSCKNMKTSHSDGKNILHYFMGAYTFAAAPPFEITSISPKPIVSSGFYKGQNYVTWKPLFVVFPGGYIFDDQHIWVAYGRQDHEIWIAKMDRQGVMDSLVPVTTVCDETPKAK